MTPPMTEDIKRLLTRVMRAVDGPVAHRDSAGLDIRAHPVFDDVREVLAPSPRKRIMGKNRGDEPSSDASVSASPAADVAVRLAHFLREMMVATWEGGVDGFDVEDLARKHKLVRQTTYDPAKHGQNDVGAEPGDVWFVIAPDVRALLASAAGQPLTSKSEDGSSQKNDEAHPDISREPEQ